MEICLILFNFCVIVLFMDMEIIKKNVFIKVLEFGGMFL